LLGVRFLFDRVRGHETVLEVDLLGRPARLSVASRRELRRVRGLHRERELLERMAGRLEPGDVAYDVGANIGLITLLLAAHHPGGGGRVHGFEPEPTNFERLRRNIELNALGDRVAAHRLALGATEGEAELWVRPGAGEGRHSLASAEGSRGSIRVPVATMAEFARSSGEPPDLLKIDVEGAEGQVLAGMAALLPDRRPRELFIEIHPKGGGDRMPDGRPIRGWLEERQFAMVWERREGSRLQQHYR
jgi:FkbM family methyltransferase